MALNETLFIMYVNSSSEYSMCRDICYKATASMATNMLNNYLAMIIISLTLMGAFALYTRNTVMFWFSVGISTINIIFLLQFIG